MPEHRKLVWRLTVRTFAEPTTMESVWSFQRPPTWRQDFNFECRKVISLARALHKRAGLHFRYRPELRVINVNTRVRIFGQSTKLVAGQSEDESNVIQ